MPTCPHPFTFAPLFRGKREAKWAMLIRTKRSHLIGTLMYKISVKKVKKKKLKKPKEIKGYGKILKDPVTGRRT